MTTFVVRSTIWVVALTCTAAAAQAQQPQGEPPARIVVFGEGSVGAAPDYAEITSGATTRARTAAQAIDANSKLMAAVNAALVQAGIAQHDIQTSRFSVQPVYAPPQPNTRPALTGFSVSNQVTVKIRQIGKVGEILDRLIAAGATDVGRIEFRHADVSRVLDQARQAAIADARRKALIYAHAAGLNLGGVAWVTESSAAVPPMPHALAMRSAGGAPIPISPGEDTLQVRITVGFDIAH